MRVLHVHQRAGFHGGVEQILYDTACGLSKRGWPQGLLHQDTEPQSEYLTVFHQTSNRESILEDFAPDLLLLHKVEQANTVEHLAERLPTVRMIHDHDLVCLRRHKYFPIGNRVCDRPAGVDCYLHLCCIQRSPPGNLLPVTLRSVGERRRAIRAHDRVLRFLVGSKWMRRELAINGIPEQKIEIVPPIPAALGNIQPLPASGEPEILFVGQVIRGKGVDLLLRALVDVPTPWHATIAGTGNHLEACKRLAQELDIDKRLDFAGWVPHTKLEPFYARAALTVVPSRWPEPFGMVGLEAMARGRPVVGFAVGGIPDWLENGVTGLLAPEANVGALATAIDRLLQDAALRTRLGEAGARRVHERFQAQFYLQQLTSILEELV
jgi:glycosyltransferase involved in cell wall biosynthesis